MSEHNSLPTDPKRPSKVVTIVSPGSPTVVMQSVVEGIPFLKSNQTRIYLAGMTACVFVFCHAAHIPLPYTNMEVTTMIGAVIAFFSLGFAIWKRVQAGKDPLSPVPPLTLK